MTKISGKYLEILVNRALNKVLSEEDQYDAEGNVDQVNRFLDDQKKELMNTVYNDNKVMSAMQNPQERLLKQKAISINKDKLKQLEKIQTDIQNQKDAAAKTGGTNSDSDQTQTTSQITSQTQSQVGTGLNTEEYERMPVLTRSTTPAPIPIPEPPKKKVVYNVAFDVKSKQPFNVKFSERGFDINGTRLSFELLETAISKNFNIVLDAGQGLVLDSVRMQKILRYKDRFQPKVEV